MRIALERKEQALLFLNRRGFAPLTLCNACGHRMACPNCDAWLVDHRCKRRLGCHHCGYPVPPPGAEWTWDAAHNPAPLSPAQAGLVELVDELCRLPFRQRVVGGYLFWARGSGSLHLAPRKWGEQDTRPLGRRPEGEGTAPQSCVNPSPLSSSPLRGSRLITSFELISAG